MVRYQVLPHILQDVNGDGVNDLFSAASLLPKSERYTEEFNGGATMLDHILMTPALHNIIASVEIDHSLKPYQISGKFLPQTKAGTRIEYIYIYMLLIQLFL